MSAIPEPLQNLEAERMVLAACLEDRDALAETVQWLEQRHFSNRAYGRVYQAVHALFERGDGVDEVTLMTELGPDLANVGGVAAVAQISEGVPKLSNIGDWIKLILDRARRRAAYNLAQRLIEQALDESVETDDLLDRHQSALARLVEVTSSAAVMDMRTVLKQAHEEIDRFVAGTGVTGVATGFPDIDELVGGWQPGTLNVIAARPGVGKSTILAQWIIAAGQAGLRGLVYSMEMPPPSVGVRMMCADAGVEKWDLKFKQTAWAKLANSYAKLSHHQTYFDPRESPTLMQIVSRAQTLHQRAKLDYIAVDYLQRVSFDARLDERVGVGQTAQGLKSLSLRLRIPVIVACQLSRGAEAKEPTLEHLAESGKIEREADIVIFLHPDQETKHHDLPTTHLIFGKHRSGACRRMPLYFEKRYNRFLSAQPADDSVLQLPRGDR